MPVRYVLSSVWVRLSILYPLSIILYVGLYVFSLPISHVMIERIYILCLIITIKSEVWTITHCLGLGLETMVSAVCLSIFLYNIWGCVFSIDPFPLWWLREYTLCLIINIKSEVWTVTHCLGLCHETMVCAVYLSIFLCLHCQSHKLMRSQDRWAFYESLRVKAIWYSSHGPNIIGTPLKRVQA